ncbi:flagellar hook basal-body protein [bacterium CPR1]|nr:flagellar hook basal-body protein [bacterium CPR1]
MKHQRLMAALFILLGTLATGWRMGEAHAASQRADSRRELAAALARNQAMREECFHNLRNQFTPGFRGSQPLIWLDQGRAQIDTRQGQIFATQTPTFLAINGPGFFLVGPPEAPVYTRDGRFTLREGVLCDSLGRALLGYLPRQPGQLVAFPRQSPDLVYSTSLRFDETGVAFRDLVRCDPVTGQPYTESVPIFTLALASFPNPQLLVRCGETGFLPGGQSGEPSIGPVLPHLTRGVVVPGSLELANVDFNQQALWLGALRSQAGLLGEPAPPPAAPAPYQAPAHFMMPGADPLQLAPFPPTSPMRARPLQLAPLKTTLTLTDLAVR